MAVVAMLSSIKSDLHWTVVPVASETAFVVFSTDTLAMLALYGDAANALVYSRTLEQMLKLITPGP